MTFEDIQNLKIGTTDVSAAYIGTTQIWGGGTTTPPPEPSGSVFCYFYDWTGDYIQYQDSSSGAELEPLNYDEQYPLTEFHYDCNAYVFSGLTPGSSFTINFSSFTSNDYYLTVKGQYDPDSGEYGDAPSSVTIDYAHNCIVISGIPDNDFYITARKASNTSNEYFTIKNESQSPNTISIKSNLQYRDLSRYIERIDIRGHSFNDDALYYDDSQNLDNDFCQPYAFGGRETTWSYVDLYGVGSSPETIVTLEPGEFVRFCLSATTLAYVSSSNIITPIFTLQTTGSYSIAGNISTLFNAENYRMRGSSYPGYDNIPLKPFPKLFSGDTNLVSAERLYIPEFTDVSASGASAQSLSNLAVMAGVFSGCTNLASAPSEINLESLSVITSACTSMFQGCTSLTQAPVIKMTTMGTAGCKSMFQDCTSLTTAGAVSATTLGVSGCTYMFSGCTSLVNPPELPALTLSACCYSGMFISCTALTEAPLLPASGNPPSNACNHMFCGCTQLSAVTCLFTKNVSYNCRQWLKGVSPTGIFTKNPKEPGGSTSIWSSGVNGIPSGWTVQEYKFPILLKFYDTNGVVSPQGYDYIDQNDGAYVYSGVPVGRYNNYLFECAGDICGYDAIDCNYEHTLEFSVSASTSGVDASVADYGCEYCIDEDPETGECNAYSANTPTIQIVGISFTSGYINVVCSVGTNPDYPCEAPPEPEEGQCEGEACPDCGSCNYDGFHCEDCGYTNF